VHRPALREVILRERPPAVLVEKPLANRPEEGYAGDHSAPSYAAGVAVFPGGVRVRIPRGPLARGTGLLVEQGHRDCGHPRARGHQHQPRLVVSQ
jgi:hypothetical protein